MKLYNRTKLPDDLLSRILVKAGRSIGAKTAQVAVVVSQGRRYASGGTAYNCFKFRPPNQKKWVKTVDGMFYITLSSLGHPDPIQAAESFFRVALHEWGHIKDFQSYGMVYAEKSKNGRRANHDSRPEELRAMNYVDVAQKKIKSKADDLILELALAIEQIQHPVVLRSIP